MIETAWLIESSLKLNGGPSWWMGTSYPTPWTPDSLRAVRFCRRQDAEAALATLPDAHVSFVSEHQWGFADPPAPDLVGELVEALREIVGCPATFSDERVDYEEIQVPKVCLEEARALLARYKAQAEGGAKPPARAKCGK